MNLKTPIGLGDLASAFKQLRPFDDVARWRIAEALGLRPASLPVQDKSPEPPRRRAVEFRQTRSKTEESGQSSEDDASRESTASIRSELVPVEDAQPAALPDWLQVIPPLDRDVGPDRPAITRAPLFEPAWTRSRLVGALSVPAAQGDIDVAATIRLLAELRPLDRLPRQFVPTLRRGLQVLFDFSDAMNFFDDDRVRLISDVRDVVGEDRMEVLGFVGCPSRGVFREEEFSDAEYAPPPPGTPVLLVTDFGLTRLPFAFHGGSTAEWAEFMDLVRAAECPLLAICPYAPEKVPPALAEYVSLITWDRDPHLRLRLLLREKAKPSRAVDSSAPLPIRLLYRRNPLAVTLAELLAVAVRIEPALLRTARLELLPEADAGTESDLWFSPLVASRNPLAIVFEPEIRDWLERGLSRDPLRLRQARECLERFRRNAKSPHVLRLEEEISFLALEKAGDFPAQTQRLLGRVLKSLVSPQTIPEDERHGLALWAAGALPQMDFETRQTLAAQQLHLTASLHLSAHTMPESDKDLPADFRESGWLLPANFPVTTLGIRNTSDGVELSEPPAEDAHVISNVPATCPRLLRICWQDELFHTARLNSPDRRIVLPPGPGTLTIQTIGGKQYELRPKEVHGNDTNGDASSAADASLVVPGVRLRHTLRGHAEPVLRIGWSRDGTHIASPSVDATVHVWDAETGHSQVVLKGHHHGVNHVAWSPGDHTIATVSFDHTFRLWSSKTGEQIFEETPHHADITTVAWSPDGRFLATGSADQRIVIWEMAPRRIAPRQTAVLESHRAGINRVTWSPDGQHLVSCSLDGQVLIWGIDQRRLIRSLMGPKESVICVDWSKGQQQLLASSSSDGTVHVWDPATGKLHRRFDLCHADVTSVSFSYDGRFLAAKSMDGRVRVLQMDSSELVAEFDEPNSEFWPAGLAFHPTQYRLATLGEYDRVVRIWDLDPHSMVPRAVNKADEDTKGPELWVLVAGLGAYELPDHVLKAAELVGRMLAEHGYGLITCAWPGVDHVTAREFVHGLMGSARSESNYLLNVVSHSRKPDFEQGGRLLRAADDGDEYEQAVQKADAVILISGQGGTRNMWEAAVRAGKPVFPLPNTGGDAAQVFQHVLSNWQQSTIEGVTHEEYSQLEEPEEWVVRQHLPRLLGRLLGTTADTGEMDRLTDVLFGGQVKLKIEAALPAFLERQRWFAGKGRSNQHVSIVDVVSLNPTNENRIWFVRVVTHYDERDVQEYLLPLAIAAGDHAKRIQTEHGVAVLTELEAIEHNLKGMLYDASCEGTFWRQLLDAIAHRLKLKGVESEIAGEATDAFDRIWTKQVGSDPKIHEPDHTTAVFDEQVLCKFSHRISLELHGEFEVGRFLAARPEASHLVPALVGAVQYSHQAGEPFVVAVVHKFIVNRGDCWSYMLDELQLYLERVASELANISPEEPTSAQNQLSSVSVRLWDLDEKQPASLRDLLRSCLATAELVGRRTAELHLALASDRDNSAFAPEPLTAEYQQSLLRSARDNADYALRRLDNHWRNFPSDVRADIRRAIERRDNLFSAPTASTTGSIVGATIRCHSDYHLGQLLHTGQDIVIVGASGEALPNSPLGTKHSPLRDVASMVRSFHYASGFALTKYLTNNRMSREETNHLARWSLFWYRCTAAAFWQCYLREASKGTFLSEHKDDRYLLFRAYELWYLGNELKYELDNRPEYAWIPLHGFLFAAGEMPKQLVPFWSPEGGTNNLPA